MKKSLVMAAVALAAISSLNVACSRKAKDKKGPAAAQKVDPTAEEKLNIAFRTVNPEFNAADQGLAKKVAGIDVDGIEEMASPVGSFQTAGRISVTVAFKKQNKMYTFVSAPNDIANIKSGALVTLDPATKIDTALTRSVLQGELTVKAFCAEECKKVNVYITSYPDIGGRVAPTVKAKEAGFIMAQDEQGKWQIETAVGGATSVSEYFNTFNTISEKSHMSPPKSAGM